MAWYDGDVRPPFRALLRLAASGAWLVGACDPSPPTASDAGPPVTAAPDAPAAVPPPASAAPATSKPPLEILKLTLTSGIENKEPVDALTKASPGKRIWAHVKVRNRSGRDRTVRLVFKVGDAERSSIRLDIEESWSFRTWGYVTLKPNDRSGELTVTVLDDMDAQLVEASLPIK